MGGSKKAKANPAAPAAAAVDASANAGSAAASSSGAIARSATGSAGRPALQLPVGYSGDRGETSIRLLRDEAHQLQRRAERDGHQTTADKMRASEIAQELAHQRALLSLHRSQSRGLALLALAVLLLLAVVWVLLGWESPTRWMERMNRQTVHADMMQATGGPAYASKQR